MSNIVKWILSTVQLTGLMVGLALILFWLAVPLSEVLNKRYAVDDDWSIIALPTGAVVGLKIAVRYRAQMWLSILAGVMLILVICSIVLLSITRQAPDSIPEGMNRLPIVLGNMMRAALLRVVLISSGLSLAVAAITTSILYLLPQKIAEQLSEPDRRPGS